MDLLTVNIIFKGFPTKSFYFYQQNTLQQAKEMILGAHTNLPKDVYNYGIFQPLNGSTDDRIQGKFLEEQKTFASYRLYGTIALHFIKKHKLGCINKKQQKFFQYVQEKKLEKLKELLEDNDPNCFDEKGITPLQYAVILNDRLIMQALIENGAFIDYRSSDLKTPLHFAVINDKYTAAHFLVMLGHILDAKDEKGFTPLYYAVMNDFPALCRYLLQSGAREIEQPDASGKTLLMYAIGKTSPVMTSDLLQYGANVHASNEKGLSCLHVSISIGTDEITRIILQNGANVNAKNNQGQIPSQVAMVLGNGNMYKLLNSYDGGQLHPSAHPFAVYPYEMPAENTTGTVKRDRVGTLKMKVMQVASTENLKKMSKSPSGSMYSLEANSNDAPVIITNLECQFTTCHEHIV